MYQIATRLGQQLELLTFKVRSRENGNEKCSNSFEKCELLRFTGCSNTIFPLFHSSKHKSPLLETTNDKCDQGQAIQHSPEPEVNFMIGHLDQERHSEFNSNDIYRGSLYHSLSRNSPVERAATVLAQVFLLRLQLIMTTVGVSRYNEAAAASAFTLFVNNGGLQIPSLSVFATVEYCEHVFKAYICKEDGKRICQEKNLKSKMIFEVCHHFLIESHQSVFKDHEEGTNEILVEDDHRMKLVKCTADKYLLFTFGKHYTEQTVQNGTPHLIDIN